MGSLHHVPDARDGLTHVERRLLHHLGPSIEPHAYSVRVVDAVRSEEARRGVEFRQGEIYDVLVRLAQPFVSRYPLVDGEGNFGSVDDDPAADPQYTEARRTPIGEAVVGSGTFPTLLANGSSGWLANIPPHALSEVAAAIALRIERPSSTLDDLLAVLPGPDYPSGGEVVDAEQLRDAYDTGEGEIDVRAVWATEAVDGSQALVITELPYGVTKGGDEGVIYEIATSLSEGYGASPRRGQNRSGIADLQDYSDKRGMRLVIELTKDAEPSEVVATLLERTQLQIAVPVRVVALVDGTPEQLTLLELIDHYIDHQRSVRAGARDEVDAAMVRDLAALASLTETSAGRGCPAERGRGGLARRQRLVPDESVVRHGVPRWG